MYVQQQQPHHRLILSHPSSAGKEFSFFLFELEFEVPLRPGDLNADTLSLYLSLSIWFLLSRP